MAYIGLNHSGVHSIGLCRISGDGSMRMVFMPLVCIKSANVLSLSSHRLLAGSDFIFNPFASEKATLFQNN